MTHRLYTTYSKTTLTASWQPSITLHRTRSTGEQESKMYIYATVSTSACEDMCLTVCVHHLSQLVCGRSWKQTGSPRLLSYWPNVKRLGRAQYVYPLTCHCIDLISILVAFYTLINIIPYTECRPPETRRRKLLDPTIHYFATC